MSTQKEYIEPEIDEDAVPLCLHCLCPVDTLDKVCPHCSRAVGQLTPYLPWESIRWEAGIWGQVWDQIWRRDVSIIGRLLRGTIIVVFVPILLVGLIPLAWRKLRGPAK